MSLNEVNITPTKSIRTKLFNKELERLNPQILKLAAIKYNRWRKSPNSLNFEPKFGNFYGIEITSDVHAIAQVIGTEVYWIFIGGYKEYSSRLDAFRKGK